MSKEERFGVSNLIDCHKFSDTQIRTHMGENEATLRMLFMLNQTYQMYAPLMVHALGFPVDVLRQHDFLSGLVLSALRTNDGQSTCDIHRDPPAPFPASP